MQKLTISRLAILIVVNCCYLRLIAASAADFSPSLIAKNFGYLNGAHLKFVVAHVNMKIDVLRYFYSISPVL
jgi:hypothetical protein